MKKKKIIIIIIIIAIVSILGIILYKYFNKEISRINGEIEIVDPIAILKKYEGTQKGNKVKNLIQEVCVYNENEENIRLERKVKIIYENIDFVISFKTMTDISKNIENNKYYVIKITGYDEQGNITEVKIAQE